ncbi:TonB-dependent receptor [Idiomarina piscisalsi]|uniref:TonB-dependent receptor n=1 Tax=Idiomarina piscisalsi TaxID=1096243 RepID=A0A432YHM6_9GAMM|nr:TonB-dependent receptor [Idiomarina piscisalsi]RUO60462.1 TonB-dependent receptor [Idiomarina piscisalsi]
MKNMTFRKSLTAAAVAASLGFPALAIAQDAQTDVNAEEEVERIQVTGSRLNRTDMEGALPVTVIDRVDLEASGDISVADFMRDTNFNSFGSYQSTSGSSGGGAAQVSLRGLGAGRTLILIDGRRAPTSPILGSGQDLNSIPMAAVERIEVLSDGASAVYGSDAIGGVVNVITRKDFDGVSVTYGVGRPTNDGGDTEEMSIVIGSSNSKSRVLLGASMNSRDVIFTRDRDYWYDPENPSGSTFSNNFGFKNPETGHSSSIGATNRLDHPDFGTAVPGLCTNEDDSDLFFMASNGNCLFNHGATSANLTSTKNTSLFGRGDYQINNDWNVYFSGSLNKVESFGRFAALPSSPWPGGAIEISPDSPNHPGNLNGYNPNASDPYYQGIADQTLSLYHRFDALGPRDNNVENTTTSFDGGFKGMIGDVGLDFGARYVTSRAINLGNNYVVAGLAQPLITDGTYNIYDPYNVYDPETGSIVEGSPSGLGMTATTNRDMFSTVKELYANVSFDMFEMGAGVSSAAFGVEYREEKYQDKYDLLSAAGQVSGSSGASAGGERDVTALYGEMLFPVLDSVDIEVAGRYDDYSDYGSDFSPKVAVRWRPSDTLLVRGSWGEGFRAPTLSNLTQEPAFSAEYTNDEATCIALTGEPCVGGSSVQVNTYSAGNVNLESENSEQIGLGVVWEASDWLNMSVDYYDIEITNSISSIGLQQAANCLRGTGTLCPSGISQFDEGTTIPDPELGVGVMFAGDDVNAAIVGGQLGLVNLGSVETDGMDFSVNTNFDLGFGTLTNNFQASYVNNYSANGGENDAGEYGYPELRASLNNGLAMGDFTVNWNIQYTDSTTYNTSDADGNPLAYGIPSWTIHNVQVNYATPWDATVTFGVNNLTDREPADASLFGTSYDYYIYNPWGRVPYIRYTQNF